MGEDENTTEISYEGYKITTESTYEEEEFTNNFSKEDYDTV